jgi:thiamine pyrophosphokinase
VARCALVGAVDFNAKHFHSQQFDCVIAVDRGYLLLHAIGCEPDLVVGDFDSLGYVPQGKNVMRFPCEKDESDMELAIRGAYEGGCDDLVLYGALAQRLDHTLANLQLMCGCARRGSKVEGIGPDFALSMLDGSGYSRIAFEAFDPGELPDEGYGRYISAFAYGGAATGVTESGLKYCLDNAEVPDDISLGLSNEFTGEAASLSVGAGNLIVTYPLGAYGHRV